MKAEALQTGDTVLINDRIQRVLHNEPSNDDFVTITTRYGPDRNAVAHYHVPANAEIYVVMDD